MRQQPGRPNSKKHHIRIGFLYGSCFHQLCAMFGFHPGRLGQLNQYNVGLMQSHRLGYALVCYFATEPLGRRGASPGRSFEDIVTLYRKLLELLQIDSCCWLVDHALVRKKSDLVELVALIFHAGRDQMVCTFWIGGCSPGSSVAGSAESAPRFRV